ncbi:MAG: UDP-N-acetylglucosamine 2-epimerase (non-hydrolyzing) [Bacteroidetes bacterium]|jgi:UDP-N-acetylglucosamine 2-epimerase|nr:UDP-N-acetylglucosamine 2-epimerase (non-hydrolyzing) [Bacteroidota bacterium]
MKKIVSIVGARPQFIKLAPLSKAIRQSFHEIIVHTGQHYDQTMSETFFTELDIPKPDYNLDCGSGNQGAQTANMLSGIEKILIDQKPDGVIIFGDTNSTLAGALAAAKLLIPTFHVEAGLRSFNRTMPEEINRIVADQTSDYLLAPTQTAMENLAKEGMQNKSFLTGDIMVDSVTEFLEKARKTSTIEKQLQLPEKYYLLTLHRPYNVDSPENLQVIFDQLQVLETHFIFPAHPRTQKIITNHQLNIPLNIKIIQPQGYFDFLKLQYLSNRIFTDSGGIQKEAYIMHKPCITLRTETEWLETVNDGWNLLADYHTNHFVETITTFDPKGPQSNVFGKNVAENMHQLIRKML